MRNPWMSMYLSAANKMVGAARSQMMAEAGRQRATANRKAAKQVMDFWTGGIAAAPPKKKQRRKKS